MRVLIYLMAGWMIGGAHADGISNVSSRGTSAIRLAKFLNGRNLSCKTKDFGTVNVRASVAKTGVANFAVTEFGDNDMEIQITKDFVVISDATADIEQYIMIRVYDEDMLTEDTQALPAQYFFNNFSDQPDSGGILCQIQGKP